MDAAVMNVLQGVATYNASATATSPVSKAVNVTIIEQAFRRAVADFVSMMPYIFTALAIIAIYVGIAVILTKLIRKLLTALKVDELLKPLFKEAYFSLTNLVIALMDVGIALLALYSIVLMLFPGQIHTLNTVLNYAARVVSVVFLIVFVFLAFNAIILRIRMEAKLRGFIFLLSFFITIVLILDITSISDQVKAALAWGVSIGIGLSIGVFAAWYFFHDYLQRKE